MVRSSESRRLILNLLLQEHSLVAPPGGKEVQRKRYNETELLSRPRVRGAAVVVPCCYEVGKRRRMHSQKSLRSKFARNSFRLPLCVPGTQLQANCTMMLLSKTVFSCGLIHIQCSVEYKQLNGCLGGIESELHAI